jgi:hypothetical protein
MMQASLPAGEAKHCLELTESRTVGDGISLVHYTA